ncbi:MAG: hypothetical protein AB8G22_28750, partial [Saprospiraceae bacterium]
MNSPWFAHSFFLIISTFTKLLKFSKRRLSLIGIVILAIFSISTAQAQANLTASQGDNDAYIDVSYTLAKNTCLTNGGTPFFDGVFIQLLANGQEVFSEIVTDVSGIGANYDNTFRHEVGPNRTFNYTVNVFQRGPGAQLCTASAQGTTTAFQPPIILEVSNATESDSITIRWQNKSKLSENFQVFRDGDLIATLTGTTVIDEEITYRDGYEFNEANSLQNGETYNYCVGTFSSLTSNLQQVCQTGSTFDIGLTATDDNPTDAVIMNWNDLTAFADKIQILRDGVVIAMLSNDVTTYRDQSPVFGKKSAYGLIIERDNAVRVQVTDIGSVPKNGLLSGKVVTKENLYAVEGAKVKIEAMAGDSTVLDSVLTDFAGCFTFTDLYYDREAAFTITVTKADQTFEPNPQLDTLTSAMPTTENLVFFQENEYEATEDVINLVNFAAAPQELQDKVDLSWDYTRLASNITFFNLYRGSSLIARLNDAQGKVTTYTDLGGVPGTAYVYRLVAHRIDQQANSAADESLFANTVYPEVASANSIVPNVRPNLGNVLLNWGPSHTSDNYAGFRIYRNGDRIAELPAGTFSYLDEDGEPNATYNHNITAFRTVDGVDYESELAEFPTSVTFPALSIPLNLTLTQVVNAMKISWDIPTLLDVNYNYDGFYIYRRATGTTDFERIGSLGKGAAPLPGQTVETFFDYTGIPEQSYEYYVTAYHQTETNLYEAPTAVQTGMFPAVHPFQVVSAVPGVGQVRIEWNTYSTSYRNIDGIILYRNNDSLT